MNNESPQGAAKGETLPQQGETQERVPRAPHERDESSSSQSRDEPSASDIGRHAQRDAESGRTDTDKGPALDETYEREFRNDAG